MRSVSTDIHALLEFLNSPNIKNRQCYVVYKLIPDSIAHQLRFKQRYSYANTITI